MELKRPAQYYWTTLIDQYQPQSLSFAFIPSRSFPNNAPRSLKIIRDTFPAETLPVPEIQPWHLPLVLASLLRTYDYPYHHIDLLRQLSYGQPVSVQAHELGFAEYVAYS